MNRTSLIDTKIEEYINHCILSLDFFARNDFEHALTDFRKSGEAFLKILVLGKHGDSDGHKIIVGELDHMLMVQSQPYKELRYEDLMRIDFSCYQFYPKARLRDIQIKGNPTAHNGNNRNNIPSYKEDADLCKSQSFELTKYLFGELNEAIPTTLIEAYNGIINQAAITFINSSDWDEFYQYVDMFNQHCKYILISPPPNIKVARKHN